MKTVIDMASWNRREHYEFFSALDESFHGIVAEVDCSWAYRHCKQNSISFFLYYLHQTLRAVNQTAALRYRIEGKQVVDYQTIHANATIMRPDHSFAFCPIDYHPDFEAFCLHASAAMQTVIAAEGLCFNAACQREDAIHFSAMPWINFTGITHARQHNGPDSVPKISVGKCLERDGKMRMPVASFVHHGLADAYHVHQFLQTLEAGLSKPPVHE